ncbi:hypothetical protein BGZ60DRAFT_528959 [Tricladium varicosporioides]|nr:hypothetical protein BGZ60DRAFT_528959 [Hymenoscyphus varicosporioides]
MKVNIFFIAVFLNIFTPAVGQSETPGPSPTNSYGCEPHGDHWHCSGAITPKASITILSTPTSQVATTATTASPHSHHDEDDHGNSSTGTLAPSPTNSMGCEPHGDHWHCSAPRTSTGVAAVVTSISSHVYETGTGTLKPSPTNSVGCAAHGDHWHCSAPVSATVTATGIVTSMSVSNGTATSAEATATTSLLSTNGAPRRAFGIRAIGSVLIGTIALVW